MTRFAITYAAIIYYIAHGSNARPKRRSLFCKSGRLVASKMRCVRVRVRVRVRARARACACACAHVCVRVCVFK